MHRHARQSRLAGIGAAGQARVARAVVDVCAEGLAGEVAVRYLAGAGVGTLRVRSSELVSIAKAVDASVVVEVVERVPTVTETGESDWEAFESDGARDVAQGAFIALRALRAVLEEPS